MSTKPVKFYVELDPTSDLLSVIDYVSPIDDISGYDLNELVCVCGDTFYRIKDLEDEYNLREYDEMMEVFG